MANVFFILGAGRSGTTALIKALSLSAEAWCLSEPVPHLNEESRWKFEGFLANSYHVLARDIGPRLAKGLSRTGKYIEKQIALVPFIRELHEMYGAHFIIPFRDGREVVTSLINWHHNRYPIIYREAAHDLPLSDFAAKIDLEVITRGYDSFDYSLPRPVRADPYYHDWKNFSRFEMCCWYWNAIYDRIFEEIEFLPHESYVFININKLSLETLSNLYEFCGLHDFCTHDAENFLKTKENALSSFHCHKALFPGYTDWSEAQMVRYYDLCWRNHHRLGLSEVSVRPRPANFGRFWQEKGIDVHWYDSFFEYRRQSHELFSGWVHSAIDRLGIGSALEIGVGLSSFYREGVFRDTSFTGIDVIPQVVSYLNQHARPKHRYLAADVTIDSLEDCKADLVYSHASIDNIPDVFAFLAGAARLTGKYLFITNYRGFFPELRQHRILTDSSTCVAFNDLSPTALEESAKGLGFGTVAVVPYLTGREDIPVETALVCAREALPKEKLLEGFPVDRIFKPYQVQSSGCSPADLAMQVNLSCFSYSSDRSGLAGELSAFRTMLRDLKSLSDRPLLALRDFSNTMRDGGDAIGLRVDVDDDLVTATAMAVMAKEEDVRLSFFILPTASYYGSFSAEGIFLRNEAVAEFALAWHSHGHEVGLHVDPFFYYMHLGIDGAAAVVEELGWLRSCGLDIVGVTGHNCASYYGAESVEIFRQYNFSDRLRLERHALYCPLGVLDIEKLDILYEGSFFISPENVVDSGHAFVSGPSDGRGYVLSPSWMRRYLADNPYVIYGPSINIWATGRDEWVLAHRAKRVSFVYGQAWSKIFDTFSELSASATLIVLHPNYFGRRRAGKECPYDDNGEPFQIALQDQRE